MASWKIDREALTLWIGRGVLAVIAWALLQLWGAFTSMNESIRDLQKDVAVIRTIVDERTSPRGTAMHANDPSPLPPPGGFDPRYVAGMPTRAPDPRP